MYCENSIKHIFSATESLGKFLTVGIIDKDVGIVHENELCDMSYHIKMLGEMGASLHNIAGLARVELKKRNQYA